ncbi:hypothetical protein HG530_009386 [Fusarium avenaceum]|nr:hypothetical protein DER45DRAFT_594751 [Fusarium avenaceum]KAI6760526.1 hypothetical protein HG530_009386 [Fusarium avenaceum]
MASDLMGKLKETLAPTSTESRNTNSYNESLNTDSYNESRNNNSYRTEPHNTSSYNTESYIPNQHNEQRDFGSNAHTAPLESTSNQHRQTEGVRTGDRIDSLVENVPGVPSTQTKPSNPPSYQSTMHQSHNTPIDAAHAPPSALRAHLGDPVIEHDYPEDSTTKRHSVSHQEEHFNLN